MQRMFFQYLFGALLCCLCLPTIVAAEEIVVQTRASFTDHQESCVVNFELVEHLMFVKVKIGNSKKAYDFILDTGAGGNVITEELAKKLKAKKLGEGTANDSSGKHATIAFYTLDAVTLGTCRVENTVTVATDLQQCERYTGRKVDGIIGTNFLRNYRVTIDYARQRITLSWSREPLTESYLIKAMDHTDGQAFTIPITVDGQACAAVIDTGCADISLPTPLLQTMDYPKEEKLNGFGSMSGGLLGNSANDLCVRVRDMQIGDFHLQGYPVSSIAMSKGALGAQFLAQFLVTIDYESNTLALTPIPQPRFNTNLFRTGMGLRLDAHGDLRVCGIWENSPAAKAGIQVGDLILELNGKKATKYSDNAVGKLSRDDAVTSFDLLIKSNGVQRHLVIQKDYLFPIIPLVTEPK